ncbi:Auxilin-related protein 1, partial [Mucuna pruriens]
MATFRGKTGLLPDKGIAATNSVCVAPDATARCCDGILGNGVLWTECGWQAVSLTDMITSTSVKKVYRKATLCIHPDKVQQKGATLEQKYTAEKVFDILKFSYTSVDLVPYYRLTKCDLIAYHRFLACSSSQLTK